MGEEAPPTATTAAAANIAVDAAPHVLLVSFPGQGHLNPLLRLGKLIAAKGALVTFTTTADAGRRILRSSSATAAVGRGCLRFEFFSDGWLDDDPRRADINLLIDQQRSHCPSAVSDLIGRLAGDGLPVHSLIINPFVPWALDVASDLGLPSAVLWVQSCAVFSAYLHYHRRLAEFPTDGSAATVTLPGLPPLSAGDIPSFLLPSNPYPALTEIILSQFANLDKADWVFANSFTDLEGSAIAALEGLGSSLVPVGPLVGGGDGDVKGDMWEAAEDCLVWLDAREPGSVAYVSVGSVVVLGDDEMGEIARGLIDCGRPFLWVVRESSRGSLPEGFIEGLGEEAGKVVAWAPQERVLTHEAVGCFVTHCGWNSTLEAVAAGVPVVTFPQWGDQVTNSRFLVDEWRVGVGLWKPVSAEAVAARVREACEGEKATEMRERAAQLKEAAMEAVAPGGSSDRNVEAFIEEVVKRSKGGGSTVATLEKELTLESLILDSPVK